MPFQMVKAMAENSMPVPARQGRNSIHQPFIVGFHSGPNRLSVSVRSSDGPSMRGSGCSSGGNERAGSAIFQLRIRILDARQVNGARFGAEVVQDRVGARVLMQLRDRRLLVVQRAEGDGLR